MTAGASRRLLSIDLLDGGEHARLDEWGNRAVLTRPATKPVSIPELFAAQVAHTPETIAPTDRFRAAVQDTKIGPYNDIPHVSAPIILRYVTDLHLLEPL